nr:MAG: wsv026-like protein [Marsupenaeus japonicus endogenous nimavirus]
MIKFDKIKWQKESFPLLFPSEETAQRIRSNVFALPSFEVYESKALLEVGRCESLTRGGMHDRWVDGYTQPRFLLRPMSLITLQGEAVQLFSVQYYKHRGNLGQGDTASKYKYGGGFIIGDGTGVGKSREIAGMIITTILVEEYLDKGKIPYRPPLIIWLTCSELLFANCKRAFVEVLTLPTKNEYSLKNMTDNGFTTIDLEGNDLTIQFITLKNFLTNTNNIFTVDDDKFNPLTLSYPTVLFLTYSGLMVNFEDIMNIFKKNIIFPTVVFCDEFHKTKNISDKMKMVIQNQHEQYEGNNVPSLYDTMYDRFGRNKKNRLQLAVADSVKLFVDYLKNKTFFVMSSATPFQNNQDLHMVDHIIRNIAPHYHLLNQYDGTPVGMNSSEYSTLFLESIIKLLYNEGIYVSRTISMKGIRCSIVQEPITTASTFMINEISSYLAEMKSLSKTAQSDITLLDDKINEIIKSEKWESSSALMSRLKAFAKAVNTKKCDDISIRTGYKLVFTEWNDAWKHSYHNQQTLSKRNRAPRKKMKTDSTSETPSHSQHQEGEINSNDQITTSKVFWTQSNRFLSGQLKVNLAACCVAINKNILLSLKNKSVLKYIQKVRKQKEPQKLVVTLEQTGDSFYNHIINEIITDEKQSLKSKNVIKINRLSILDKAPASHFIINAYKTLLRSILLDTTYRITCLENKKICFLLLPRLPPPAPLILLNENFLDNIESGVGERRYIEVTKRKYSGRLTSEGTLEIIPKNTSPKNINRDFQLFKHSNSVDVAIVGKTGNTGFDFHDSKDNIARARRIHIIADLPHDAISFLQSIGRTHRNNQRSLPRYCLFLTDIPTEKRFVDILESRVKDSKAGTHGDRYCQNTLSLKNKENNKRVLKKTSDDVDVQHSNVCPTDYRRNFNINHTSDNALLSIQQSTRIEVDECTITNIYHPLHDKHSNVGRSNDINMEGVSVSNRVDGCINDINRNSNYAHSNSPKPSTPSIDRRYDNSVYDGYHNVSYCRDVEDKLQHEYNDKIDFLENGFVMKVLGTMMQLLAGEYNPLDIFLQIAKLGYRDGYLFIPLEGMGGSKIYLTLVEFAFECAAVLLNERKKYKVYPFPFSRAAKATVSLMKEGSKRKILDEILECLCYFYDSSIMDFGLRGSGIKKKEIENVVSVGILFWEKFSPTKMTKASYLLATVKGLKQSETAKSKISIRDIFYRSAVRVFGYATHDNAPLPPPTDILTVKVHNGTMKFVMDGYLSNIPMVIACNLLDTLKDKTPYLLLDLCNEITPYRKENTGNVESCFLILSRILINKGLTYKQFRNYFMTIPLSEQYLLQSLFSKMREWLSTEEWFSRMCMMRKANYISAEYIEIITCPDDINRLYAKVNNKDINNVTCDCDFVINCRLSLCGDNEKMKRPTSMVRGDIDIQLTPKNTIFINSLFETLLLTNARRDMVKLKFWNSESVRLPSVALVCYQ